MNLLELLIPKQKAQTIKELESWTVTWYIKEGWSGNSIVQSKVFISIDDRDKFVEQLKGCAKFIGAWINVTTKHN